MPRRTRATNTRNDSPADSSASSGRRRALIVSVLALPILLGFYALLLFWSTPRTSGDELRLDQFFTLLQQDRVRDATILEADDRIVGVYDQGRYWVAYGADRESLFSRLVGEIDAANVQLKVEQQPIKGLIAPTMLILPALIMVNGLLIIFLIFFGRGSPTGGFERSGARRFGGQTPITFSDIAGLDEAMEELQEVSDYLADPDRFMAMGAAVPKGILLTGPPGCGKTLLARAVAGESSVPYFSISGSDFVEMFVGVGAARIRDLFNQVAESAPAIVFIDELDAVGRHRNAAATSGQDEREATLNQLLVEMDGFESGSGVVVLAATNRADILDHALLRPGRFDRRISIDRPDLAGREGILGIHVRGKPLADTVDLEQVARRTVGFSGADLANVINEAALLAARHRMNEIDQALILQAIERVVAGPERRTRIISPQDRRRIAVHETGHAIVATALRHADAVDKISIVARSHVGGFTWYLPETDQVLATRSQLNDRIASLLAGRTAERIVLDEVSSAAEDDLDRATQLARWMVGNLGMGRSLGALSLKSANRADLGVELVDHSDPLLAEFDADVRAVLDEAEIEAAAVIDANRELLDEIADALVERENLEGEALSTYLGRVRASGAGAVTDPALLDG